MIRGKMWEYASFNRVSLSSTTRRPTPEPGFTDIDDNLSIILSPDKLSWSGVLLRGEIESSHCHAGIKSLPGDNILAS